MSPLCTIQPRSHSCRSWEVYVRAAGPLRIDWGTEQAGEPDAARIVPLSMHVEPAGYACLGEWKIDHSPVSHPAVPVYEDAALVVVPARITLRSGDGRLSATLPGYIETSARRARAWEGSLQVVGMMTEIRRLAQRHERPGFDVADGTLRFLSLWLNLPFDGNGPSQLSMQGFTPYAGVPAYPDISEAASNRASCFGAANSQGWREARVLPERMGEAKAAP